MLIENADYFVRIVDFPVGCGGCNGVVALNDDGTYSVYINARASEEQKKRAMRHEYDHMANDDMYGDKDIRDIENI